MPFDFMHGWGWGIPWGLIFVIIVLLISSNNKKYKNMPAPESALDILKKRYAKGEITKEQFDQMKKDIG